MPACDKRLMLGSIVRWPGARTCGLLLLCLVSLLGLGGCSADVTPGEATTAERSAVTGVTLKSIALTPAAPSLYVDAKQQLTATGSYSDGSTSDITQTVDWSSNNPVIASVSNQGLVTGVSKGSVTVSAQLGSVKGKVTVKVLLTLASLAINPDKSKLAPSVTQALAATGTYSNGTTKNLTSSVT